MGLAASQCRLLFLTSRQNDVSAKMQRISNDKMVLARDEEEVSDKYNRMLNNPTYTYVSADGSELSYESLMGSSAAAVGAVNILTNSAGKVVLSPSLAGKFGLSATEGSGNDFVRLYPSEESFIRAAEPDSADVIISKLSSVTVNTTSSGGVITAEQKEKLLNFKSQWGEYPKTKTADAASLLNNANLSISGWQTSTEDNISSIPTNLGQLLSGRQDVIIKLADDGSGEGSPTDMAKNNLYTLTMSMADAIGKAMGISDGGRVREEMKSLADELCGHLGNLSDNSASPNYQKYYSGAGPQTEANLRNTNDNSTQGLLAKGCAHSGQDRDFYMVNASTLAKLVLQKMMSIYGNENYGCTIRGRSDFAGKACNEMNADVKGLNYSSDKVYTFGVNSHGLGVKAYEEKVTAYTGLEVNDTIRTFLGAKSQGASEAPEVGSAAYNINLATYYKNLYHSLASAGWTTQSAETIQQNLNSGFYSINGAQISASGAFDAVKDPDYKEKAEAYYKSEMSKINRKEKEQDTQMQKLQTEYSSITSDLESVKSILNANVQKSFAYCQTG